MIRKSILFVVIVLVWTANANAQAKRPQTQDRIADNLKNLVSVAKNDSLKLDALNKLSFYFVWSNPDSALKYIQIALLKARQLNFPDLEVRALMNSSMYSTIVGDYSQALNYSYSAYRIAEKLENKRALSRVYISLALAYRDQGEFEHAIQYAKESYQINRAHFVEDSLMRINMLSHIGSVFEKFNQLDSALFYINKAYETDSTKALRNTLWLNTRGNIYGKKGKYSEALTYYAQGILVARVRNTIRDIADMYNGMAKIYLKKEQLDSSIFFAKKTITTVNDAYYPLQIMEATKLLSELYKIRNEKDSVLKYMEQTAAIRDSLFSRESVRRFQSITFSEQMRKQEIEAAKLKFRNRLRMNAFLGSTFTFIVIAIFLFIIVRRKQKAKQKIESAFNQLKATQSQLIQSEKMASLGELTAGIAHEIQNPLNFVNNFSEVNKELLVELKDEIKKGNFEEVDAIADDVISNEQKINHHGKRAADIVKGMLQHSRTSSGQKEPTDINALADEYLRLAYHGLRAKDKSFNAEFKTEFDESLPKINVIPQDIGRVLLNLINNAFYAVDKRAKENNEDYKPFVVVKTNLESSPLGGPGGQWVKISVKDNGPGIPAHIVDKIFQPFFTTKPTGQGTGLGLSLSYDIVKAHGGELRVETKEGEGTEFIIQIPIKSA